MRLLIVLALLLSPLAVWADEAEVEVADAAEAEPTTEAENVFVKFVLPKFANRQLPLGEVVEVLVGIRNGAEDALNATRIFGQLSNEAFVQNLTTKPLGDLYGRIGSVVEPGREASFQYHFMPAVQLPAGDYNVALTVAYEGVDGGEEFTTLFFNQTVTLVEKMGPVDFQLLGLIAMIFGVSGATLFVVSELFSEHPLVKQVKQALEGVSQEPKKKAKKAEGPKRDPTVTRSSFLVGTVADPTKREKSKGGEERESSKKK